MKHKYLGVIPKALVKTKPNHGWSGKQKADYLERQFERVCAGELSMGAYKQLKKEVMRI